MTFIVEWIARRSTPPTTTARPLRTAAASWLNCARGAIGLRAEHSRNISICATVRRRAIASIIFPAAPGPVLMFIHGGYWQMRAKEDFSALARGPLAHGIHVAMSVTRLRPTFRSAVSMKPKFAQRYAGSLLTPDEHGGDAGRMYSVRLVGRRPPDRERASTSPRSEAVWPSAAFTISTPMRWCYINEKLKLDEREAHRLSPLLKMPPSISAVNRYVRRRGTPGVATTVR